MRRSEKEIRSRAKIEEILQRESVLYLGLVDNGQPYVVPMNFGFADGCLYLHSALEGRKMEVLKRNPQVSFAVVTDAAVVPNDIACHSSARYRSVIGFGRVSFLAEPADKIKALETLMRKFAPGPFTFDDGALAKTVALKITIESMTGKQAGEVDSI